MTGRQLAGWRFIEPDANCRTSDCEVRGGAATPQLQLEVPINLRLRPLIKSLMVRLSAKSDFHTKFVSTDLTTVIAIGQYCPHQSYWKY
jgi:hypothetical protein